MKVAIVGANRRDSMESHFCESLVFAGNNARIFDIFDKFPYNVSAISPYFSTIDKICRTYSDWYDKSRFMRLAGQIDEFGPDLVVCFYRDIHPSMILQLKRSYRKIVHVNPDQFVTLGYQQVIASDYDAWFMKDQYMVDFFRKKAGLNAFVYNEAFNPRYNPKPDVDKFSLEKEIGIDVMTYGTLYPYRTRMVRQLIDSGIDIRLFGVVPNRFFDNAVASHCTGQYIIGGNKAKILYGSKIVFNNFHYAEIESVNCRFFEANGCGAFQICDYRPILHQLLPVEPGLVSFKTTAEAIDKISYYLAHDNERIELSRIVYDHFIKNYTYDKLVAYILEIVSGL